ncbi:unnamed protein product [Gordionus sp. m RMFG-2023]|uniref:uncharacterized protein LOC135931449 isoform X2 n=1 Tax=Gordionus sp. m RMFG-2023 TaxID=3053472 RepID=UPI0030E3ED6D
MKFFKQRNKTINNFKDNLTDLKSISISEFNQIPSFDLNNDLENTKNLSLSADFIPKHPPNTKDIYSHKKIQDELLKKLKISKISNSLHEDLNIAMDEDYGISLVTPSPIISLHSTSHLKLTQNINYTKLYGMNYPKLFLSSSHINTMNNSNTSQISESSSLESSSIGTWESSVNYDVGHQNQSGEDSTGSSYEVSLGTNSFSCSLKNDAAYHKISLKQKNRRSPRNKKPRHLTPISLTNEFDLPSMPEVNADFEQLEERMIVTKQKETLSKLEKEGKFSCNKLVKPFEITSTSTSYANDNENVHANLQLINQLRQSPSQKMKYSEQPQHPQISQIIEEMKMLSFKKRPFLKSEQLQLNSSPLQLSTSPYNYKFATPNEKTSPKPANHSVDKGFFLSSLFRFGKKCTYRSEPLPLPVDKTESIPAPKRKRFNRLPDPIFFSSAPALNIKETKEAKDVKDSKEPFRVNWLSKIRCSLRKRKDTSSQPNHDKLKNDKKTSSLRQTNPDGLKKGLSSNDIMDNCTSPNSSTHSDQNFEKDIIFKSSNPHTKTEYHTFLKTSFHKANETSVNGGTDDILNGANNMRTSLQIIESLEYPKIRNSLHLSTDIDLVKPFNIVEPISSDQRQTIKLEEITLFGSQYNHENGESHDAIPTLFIEEYARAYDSDFRTDQAYNPSGLPQIFNNQLKHYSVASTIFLPTSPAKEQNMESKSAFLHINTVTPYNKNMNENGFFIPFANKDYLTENGSNCEFDRLAAKEDICTEEPHTNYESFLGNDYSRETFSRQLNFGNDNYIKSTDQEIHADQDFRCSPHMSPYYLRPKNLTLKNASPEHCVTTADLSVTVTKGHRLFNYSDLICHTNTVSPALTLRRSNFITNHFIPDSACSISIANNDSLASCYKDCKDPKNSDYITVSSNFDSKRPENDEHIANGKSEFLNAQDAIFKRPVSCFVPRSYSAQQDNSKTLGEENKRFTFLPPGAKSSWSSQSYLDHSNFLKGPAKKDNHTFNEKQKSMLMFDKSSNDSNNVVDPDPSIEKVSMKRGKVKDMINTFQNLSQK